MLRNTTSFRKSPLATIRTAGDDPDTAGVSEKGLFCGSWCVIGDKTGRPIRRTRHTAHHEERVPPNEIDDSDAFVWNGVMANHAGCPAGPFSLPRVHQRRDRPPKRTAGCLVSIGQQRWEQQSPVCQRQHHSSTLATAFNHRGTVVLVHTTQ